MKSLLVALLILTTASLAGCATTSPVGVRAPFQNARVTEVTVVDFYSISSFGMSPEELDATVDLYEEAALAWLRANGTSTYSPAALRESLEKKGANQTFIDGVLLDRTLSELFEPSDGELPLESRTVKILAGKGAFPATALLFGEVVYHTRGTCDGEVRRFNDRAVVLDPVDAATPPTPCIVSHVDAKLVDAASGTTMWHNRLLVEQWYSGNGEELGQPTIVRVVELALEGDNGILPLLERATPAG